MMLLPDVNVWLALAFDAHSGHLRAKRWFEAGSESCCFCRQTQQGFLRLATNAKAFPDDAVTMAEAWVLYDRILGDPRVEFRNEPVGLEQQWRTRTQTDQRSHHVWSDAFLIAFAQASGCGIVTFDRGFASSAELRLTLL